MIDYLALAKQARARLQLRQPAPAPAPAGDPGALEVAEVRSIAPAPRPADAAALTAQYRIVIERLWDLAAPHVKVDRVEVALLLDQQAKLCDDLGPLWAFDAREKWTTHVRQK